MIFLNGIKNFLETINDNWTTIVIIIGCIFSIYTKIKNLLQKSKDKKIEIAKTQIKELMLKFVTNAECTYSDWSKSGKIKRSEVFEQIFEKYPILKEVYNQSELIQYIDDTIDETLTLLKDVINKG